MDVMMPHMNGIESVQRLRARFPNVRVIMLTSYGGENHVQAAIEAGAMGFLLKNATAEELARAIRTAYRGSRVLAPEATDALVQSMRHDPTPGDDLTAREREVLNLIVCGYNNTEIAERLFLSVSTVKFHVSAILSKLGVSNRIEAVALAIQNGLVKRVV